MIACLRHSTSCPFFSNFLFKIAPYNKVQNIEIGRIWRPMIWFDTLWTTLIQIFQCCFCSMRPCPILEKDVVTPRKVIHFRKHTWPFISTPDSTKRTEVLPNLEKPTEIITFFGNVFLFTTICSVEISPLLWHTLCRSLHFSAVWVWKASYQ